MKLASTVPPPAPGPQMQLSLCPPPPQDALTHKVSRRHIKGWSNPAGWTMRVGWTMHNDTDISGVCGGPGRWQHEVSACRWEKKQSLDKPGQAQRVPGRWGSQISRQSAHEGGQVVSPTHRPPLPPGNIPGTHFCWRMSQPQGHSAAGRVMSMKNYSDNIGNRTSDFTACSAVPQPTGHQQRAPAGGKAVSKCTWLP